MSREQNTIENEMHEGNVEDSDGSDDIFESIQRPPAIIRSQRKLPNFQIWDEDALEYKTYQISRAAISESNEAKVYIYCFQTRNRQKEYNQTYLYLL